MNCSEIKENLETYLDEQTDAVLNQRITQHLDYCKLCQAEFAELNSVSNLLKKELPASPTIQVDNKVMAAFRQYHTKETNWNWFAILTSILAPKPIFAILTLCVLTGLAFLLGRMTVPTEQVLISSPPQIIEKEVPKEIVKYVEVSTTKIVEVPVEKIITRTVYRHGEIPQKTLSPTIQAGNSPNKIRQIDLSDFQPISEITPRILKKGELNEK